MSWGGTMFEYLMPQLLMRSFPGTLLDQSCRAERAPPDRVRPAARRALGHFGIGVCLHRSRGQLPVPGLRRAGPGPEARPGRRSGGRAVRHGAGEPGRSPAAAAQNFERARRGGARRALRVLRGARLQAARSRSNRTRRRRRPSAVVGARVLRASPGDVARRAGQRACCEDVFVARFHADPRIQATELLLQERVPREAILSEPRPAESATGAAVAARVRVAALPLAAHDAARTRISCRTAATRPPSRTPAAATACGATWPSRAGARIRRRTPGRTTSTCATRGRSASGRPRTCRSCREPDQFDVDVRSRQGHVPPPRRRHRDAARDHGVVRGRRGGQAADDHATAASRRASSKSPAMPRWCWGAPKTTSRIRRSASCSSRPSSIRRAPALCSPAVRARLTSPRSWAFHVLGVDGRRLRRRGRVGDRPRALHRPRPHATPTRRRSKAGPVGHDRCGARSDRRVARAGQTAARRRRAGRRSPPASRPIATRRSRWRASTRDGSAASRALLDGVHARPHHAPAPRPQRRAGDAVRPARVTRVRLGHIAASARPILPPTHSVSRTCGATASPAICRSCWCASSDTESLPLVRQLLNAQEYWRVKGLRADVVILNEHPADYLDEVQNAADADAAGAAVGADGSGNPVA